MVCEPSFSPTEHKLTIASSTVQVTRNPQILSYHLYVTPPSYSFSFNGPEQVAVSQILVYERADSIYS